MFKRPFFWYRCSNRGSLFVALLCMHSLVGALMAQEAVGPADRFHWAGWQIPAGEITERSALSIQQDEDAESTREVTAEDGTRKKEKVALMLRVSRRAIAKGPIALAQTPLVEWEDIRPGVYRVSARMKLDGPPHIIGTPVLLSVSHERDTILSESFTNCDFREPDRYNVVSFLYEVDPGGEKRLKARESRHPWHYAAFLAEVYPGWRERAPAVQPPPASRGIRIAVALEKTKYLSKPGTPPNSVRSVSLDWVKLERIEPSPSLTVRYVRAQKRWMRPGEETSFEVSVENFSDKAWTRPLRVLLVRGTNEESVLHEEEITLEPGKATVLCVPWLTDAETPIWGYEVRAEITAAGKVESSARDFFSVHPEVYAVHLMGTRFRRTDPFRQWGRCNNLVEVFAATEGDCARVLSSADQWLCGMSKVATSYKIVRNVVEHNRRLGVATHMYLFAGGTGTAVIDLYVHRPEHFCTRISATDQVYRLLSETAEQIRQHDFNTGPFEMPLIPHVEHHINYWHPEVMERVTRQTLEFLRKTGYQGIRFDVGLFSPKCVTTAFGEKLPYDEGKTMQQAAQNFNDFREAVLKEFPDFEFGANMDSWAYLEHVGKRDVTPPPPEQYPEFVAFARAHGMFMDEGTMNAPLYHHYMNRFEDALWSMVRKREVVRRYGGVYQLFSPHRDGTGYFAHDDIYWAVMIVASGSYYVGSFAPPPYSKDSIGHFITRFGEFFRSKDLKTLPDARQRIFVDSPAELWYADTAVWEDRGSKRRYVIPLINPPLAERLRRNKTNELPPPILEPFKVQVQMPEGYGRARAWMLTWEPRIACVPLEARAGAGAVVVELPGISLFRTLVVEFEK